MNTKEELIEECTSRIAEDELKRDNYNSFTWHALTEREIELLKWFIEQIKQLK